MQRSSPTRMKDRAACESDECSRGLMAIVCLRAQTGVGPQVTSHVFGLRKAVDDGTWEAEEAMPEQGTKWLASDAGSEWILKTVDEIVEGYRAAARYGFLHQELKLSCENQMARPK